jgi:prevent-host-death family protein
MRQEILSISKAKATLLSLIRAMEEEGRGFILTKDGEPVGALIPMDEYEAYVETYDVLQSPSLMKDLAEALEDEHKGRIYKRNKKGQWVRFQRKSSSPRVKH